MKLPNGNAFTASASWPIVATDRKACFLSNQKQTISVAAPITDGFNVSGRCVSKTNSTPSDLPSCEHGQFGGDAGLRAKHPKLGDAQLLASGPALGRVTDVAAKVFQGFKADLAVIRAARPAPRAWRWVWRNFFETLHDAGKSVASISATA